MTKFAYQDLHTLLSGDRRLNKDRRSSNGNAFNGPDRRKHKDRRDGLERRKYRRFQLKGLAFAKLWSEYEEDYIQDLGQLLDISRAGLSLRCPEKTEKSAEPAGLGIFLSGSDFRIDNIPFIIVSDLKITDGPPPNGRVIKRFGIKFDKLTTEQKSKLDFLLLNHTQDDT